MLTDHADLAALGRLTDRAVQLLYLIDSYLHQSGTEAAEGLARWRPFLEEVGNQLEALPEQTHSDVNRAYRNRWRDAYHFGGVCYASGPDAVRTLVRSC